MAVIDVEEIDDHERYRAELASISKDGKRKWIYARKPRGRLYRWRTILSWFLLLFLVLAPFVKVNGHQFLLFNIIEREFVFFGIPFWPNDFYLVALMFLTGVVTIVLFTSTLGRLWCGWLCPQTIFMEMVFRKIEWLLDGTPKEQALRDAGAWTVSRVMHRIAKISIFFTISFLISNVFLAYVVGSDSLLQYIVNGPFQHWDLFVGLLFFAFVFFMVFYRFREQACLIVCPYGRYMSALVDDNTMAVSYDFRRGEPRGKFTRDDAAAKRMMTEADFKRPNEQGDCVDCYQCVTVCPTGIDIRNGIQLECVSCTACIDACNEVMDKVGLPRGLIRHTSQSVIESGKGHWFTRRIAAYGIVWLLLIATVVTLFILRADVDVKILRQEGTTWVTTTEGLGNVYRIQIINKSHESIPITVKVLSPSTAVITPVGIPDRVEPQQILKGRFIVSLPKATLAQHGTKIRIAVLSGTSTVYEAETSFITP